MAPVWAVPVGILAGLAVAMFLFIWWWFPRAYKRGVAIEHEEIDRARRRREQRALEEAELADSNGPPREGSLVMPPPVYAAKDDGHVV